MDHNKKDYSYLVGSDEPEIWIGRYKGGKSWKYFHQKKVLRAYNAFIWLILLNYIKEKLKVYK